MVKRKQDKLRIEEGQFDQLIQLLKQELLKQNSQYPQCVSRGSMLCKLELIDEMCLQFRITKHDDSNIDDKN